MNAGILNKIMENQYVCDFALYDDLDEKIYGFIRAFNDDLIFIEQVNSFGDFWQFTVMYIEDIFRIDWDRAYLTRLAERYKPDNAFPKTPEIDLSSMNSAISSLSNFHDIFTLAPTSVDEDIVYIGTVEILGTELIVRCFGVAENSDAWSRIIRISDIRKASIGDKYCREVAAFVSSQ